MDLLARRYANPFLILDQFISNHQLYDFSVEIMQTIADEKVHEKRWQYYLHKVWDSMSFEEYVHECERMLEIKKEQIMTHEQIGNVVNESRNMLEEFM